MRAFEVLLGAALVLGPLAGYVPQYREIAATRRHDALSPTTCLVLILANVLRVAFWLLRRFDTALLLQSIAMVAAQLALLELIVRVQRAHRLDKAVAAAVAAADLPAPPRGAFWAWDRFEEYVAFVVCFAAAAAAVAAANTLFVRSVWLTEAVGFLALSTEATLAMPQVYHNWRRGSCAGLRYAAGHAR